MAKNNIVEDTASQFATNVTGKINKSDKPQKLDGEIETINKKALIKNTDGGADYSKGISKDVSKSSAVAHKVGDAEQKGTMNNMPMVKKLDEDEDADVELTEEEIEAYNEHRAAVMESLAERMAEFIPDDNTPIDVSEHINVLFEGQDLSEEFKNKATTIFEAAVRSDVLETLGAILEAATDLVIENDIHLTESYDEHINTALIAIAEGWADANAVGIQSRLKTEITEDFIHGLIKLMNDHNIMLPEEKVDVVEAMADEIMGLRNELNEQISVNIEMRSVLEESFKEAVVEKLTEGLTDTQASKMRNLCESIDFTDDFETKAVQLRESYFGDKSKPRAGKGLSGEEKILNESEVNSEAKVISEEATKKTVDENTTTFLNRFAPKR